MKKLSIIAAVATALTMSAAANAEDAKNQCVVKVGNVNVVMAEKADCKSGGHDCGGKNKADDKGVMQPDAWIKADEKACAEINKLLNDKSVMDKAAACEANAACKAANDKKKVTKDGKEVEVGKIDFDAVKKADMEPASAAPTAEAPAAPAAPATPEKK